jgi:hypothetical protein
MKRLALAFALSSAAGLALSALAALPGDALAFEVNTASATNSDGSPRFVDPDDQPLPAPLQMAPDRSDTAGGALIPSAPAPDTSGWGTYSGSPLQRPR